MQNPMHDVTNHLSLPVRAKTGRLPQRFRNTNKNIAGKRLRTSCPLQIIEADNISSAAMFQIRLVEFRDNPIVNKMYAHGQMFEAQILLQQ